MATLICLACGQENNPSQESCTSCSSPLNMKLCSGCEAIIDVDKPRNLAKSVTVE